MRRAVAVWRLARATLHLSWGMLLAAGLRRRSAARRHALIRDWSAAFVKHLGVALQVSGTPRPGATLVVSNHVSWLDVAAIHAAAPHLRFVAKADVLKWPLLGGLIRGGGTLFIERERKRDALRVVHDVAAALRGGDSVAVFPEGTTGAGRELLPFHANLLQAAIATATPVQPVCLRYADAHQPFSPSVEYVGPTTLMQSLWRVACARGLRVQVELLPAVTSAHADRRALAAYLRDLIAARLQT